MLDEFLFVEKYRPKTIEETIIPDNLKDIFQKFVEQKNIPNLILSGSAGIGKTTIAKAMLEELNCDYIVINGSMNGNIDTLRNEILKFASTVSFSGGRKYVILDEADYLTNNTQAALRNFIEDFSKNCGFIMTCNFLNRIIEPLHSRCSVVEFKFSKKEIATLASKFMKRVCHILEKENIEYDKQVVAEIIKRFYPDWRRVLNELQSYSSTGKIDSGILTNFDDSSIKELVSYLKDKNYTSMRKWVAENCDNDSSHIFRYFFDNAVDYIVKKSIPLLVLLIAKYQYQATFAVDQEINVCAFFTEVMIDCEFI